jgi:hypothetical protein
VLTTEQLKGTHIAIATPCYGGQVFQNYFMSILKLVFNAHAQNVSLSFLIRGGDSLIPRIRNSMVAEFLATETYTHLLWVDADLGFEPEAVFRLIKANRDVAAGVYPMKTQAWPEQIPQGMTKQEFEAKYARFPFNPKDGKVKIDEDGFIEVLDAPTGLMLIKREALMRMVDAYPDHKIIADNMPGLEHIAEKIKKYDYRFFDVMTEPNGRYLSEDYAFCRRWQAIGGRIFVDAASNITHQGAMLYGGNFLEHLRVTYTKPVAPNGSIQAVDATDKAPDA